MSVIVGIAVIATFVAALFIGAQSYAEQYRPLGGVLMLALLAYDTYAMLPVWMEYGYGWSSVVNRSGLYFATVAWVTLTMGPPVKTRLTETGQTGGEA